MAKAPSAKVAMTSGQGVSRLAYQKANAIGKGASVPGEKNPKTTLESGRNDYAKTTLSKSAGKSETYAAPASDEGKPPKPSVSLNPAKSKKLEVLKSNSGFLTGKK